MRNICNNWEFTPRFTTDFLKGLGEAQQVRLPHTNAGLPLHYADHNDYQMICGYRRKLFIDADLEGKRLFLQFDGAAHIATVYVNGQETVTHRTGYTAFRVEISQLVDFGAENLIVVRLDSTENPQVPPFGFVIDYLTYGGLYREVWLDVRENSYISDIYITTPQLDTAQIQVTVDNPKGCTATAEILDDSGKALVYKQIAINDSDTLPFPDAKPWSVDDPQRYTCRVCLFKDGQPVDSQSVVFGFRTAEFRRNGFYLNGKKLFIRGLNRHQCFPYIGYAATEHLQREDARILKEELCCNAVRTSHYPQSQHFIDECDRLGLLVFTEIPGWQHIGDAAWKEQAVENVREMVMQYRNHPSIVLWGVRINESGDCDERYTRTNAVAHELDPSRPTSGVRCILQSSLLEDVYSYNDFSHTGNNPGVRKKKTVTPDMSKPLMVTECNGHMYPTKSFDDWTHRQNHAMRHARVQNDAAASGEHVGCFAWCMFDYATHKDFGAGDRICYHGVLDSFRNPKLAAAVYASQGDQHPVLQISSTNDIGDYAASVAGTTYAFTNADEVWLYKNDQFVSKLAQSEYTGMPHGPMAVTDTIGALLESQEGYPKDKAETIRKCLNAVAKYGATSLPPREILRMAFAMMRYKMTMKDAMALYGKYTSSWGSEAVVWRFDAIKDGKVVASVTRSASTKLHLEVTPSQTKLQEGDVYDMAAVRIRVLDEFGNPAVYAQLPVTLELTGEAELVGPKVITAEGGMCGTYIRTTGNTGSATLTICTEQTEPVTIHFAIGQQQELS